MLDEITRTRIVDDLEGAYRTRAPLPLLTRTYPGIEVEDAYRIQEAFVARRVAGGARIAGYKVGLTSKPMQEMAGSDEPDFSAVTDGMFLPEGTPISAANFFDPMIEIEIAFVMKSALKGPGILPVDVIRATDFVVPAIEIVDFRVARAPGMNIIDTVADLAACGGVVLGANPRRLEAIDVRRVQGSILRNGHVEQEGEASAVLGNPVTAVAWLANKLGGFGVAFEPGQVILTGSFVRAFPIKAGDEIVCRFDQGLGDVATSFV
ncbi:2-keto-4-pentenoate hydratase [Phenylobacterium soli]|uniref:4-oxalocrotonate decarboxylase n=1 Tax=Phenylobacterium soli TaxID=2170551 RepID=A0A328AMW9_9CAUL|nr:fumarylacetoacetate hydrolase family protein [Phenylobacterium soli]RAK55685.1 4-oxalocrotonate decarboxylase [Phenylobacterium soli]